MCNFSDEITKWSWSLNPHGHGLGWKGGRWKSLAIEVLSSIWLERSVSDEGHIGAKQTPQDHIMWKSESLFMTRSGVLRTQKLKTHLLRTHSSKFIPLKPGLGQIIAIHASPTANDLSPELISTFLVHSLSFYPKFSPKFFLGWMWLTRIPVWARRIK